MEQPKKVIRNITQQSETTVCDDDCINCPEELRAPCCQQAWDAYNGKLNPIGNTL